MSSVCCHQPLTRAVKGSFTVARKSLPSPVVLRQLLHYDAETGRFHWLERPRTMFPTDRSWKTWNSRFAGREAFTANIAGYRVSDVLDCQIYGHRAVWAWVYGAWPSEQIDHINGNRADNRLVNLREVNAADNRRNSKLHHTNTSGHAGVSKTPHGWQAYILSGEDRKSLGSFATREEAIAARQAAERQHGFHPNHGRAL